MNHKLTTIDPNQGNIPNTAIIKKVVSENDRLPNGEHEKAVKAFYFSDSIASGIGKDFAFVEKGSNAKKLASDRSVRKITQKKGILYKGFRIRSSNFCPLREYP